MQYYSLQYQTLLLSPPHPQLGVVFALAPSLHSFWVISPVISSSMLGTYRLGEFIFQCPTFFRFHTVHGVLKALGPSHLYIHFVWNRKEQFNKDPVWAKRLKKLILCAEELGIGWCRPICAWIASQEKTLCGKKMASFPEEQFSPVLRDKNWWVEDRLEFSFYARWLRIFVQGRNSTTAHSVFFTTFSAMASKEPGTQQVNIKKQPIKINT